MDFIKGNIAGYVGAIAVYPIDLVKSNMQLQTSFYKNGYDCFKQIIRKQGFAKLYAGSFIQIIGVGPEKAIKLYTNQTLLEKNINPIIAGSISGLCQVIVTNPIENIKIQYQTNLDKKLNLFDSVKMIGGIKKLYRGSIVCAMRDIPFSAIYWPTYAMVKSYLIHDTLTTKSEQTAKSEQNKLQTFTLSPKLSYFLSGMIAGIPAAYLVTPFDVIKTRIQAKPQLYPNIKITAQKIWLEEGFKAFFKGGGWRVAKSSPQFGITLFVYEMLK